MPRQTGDFLVVPLERGQFLHGPNIVEFDELIARCSQQPVAIVVPGHLGDSVFVTVERAETGGDARVPQFDKVVFGATGHDGGARVPINSFHIPSVAFENALFRV